MSARSILAVGVLVPIVLVLVGGRAAAPVQVPRFEVDPLWPRPLPNRWLLGSATGVGVGGNDNVFVVHLTDSFNARTEIGLATNPPTGECCAPAPNVLEFDGAGNLLGHWGPAAGASYRWPEMSAGIAVDGKGNLWIGGAGGADTQILVFSRDGKLVTQFGTASAPAVAPAPTPGRRPATPALPANSNSMDAFGGVAGFSFD